MHPLLLGTLAGGVASFIWNAISWMALPWHHAVYRRVRNEDALGHALNELCDTDGVYGLPGPPPRSPGMDKAARDAADLAVYNRMQAGPLATIVFQRSGYGSIKPKLAIALITGMLTALVFTALLLWVARGQSVLYKATLVGLAAFGGVLSTRLPDWNWHGFSVPFVLVRIADMTIGWFLVGFVLAWLTP